MDLPRTGFLRLRQIIGDQKTEPPIPPIIPISKAQWFLNVKTYPEIWPQPIRLGPSTVVYRVEDIHRLINHPPDFPRRFTRPAR